jgi:hypothetical protein
VTTLDASIIPELIEGLLRERKSILVSSNCTLAVLRGLNPDKEMVIVLPM